MANSVLTVVGRSDMSAATAGLKEFGETTVSSANSATKSLEGVSHASVGVEHSTAAMGIQADKVTKALDKQGKSTKSLTQWTEEHNLSTVQSAFEQTKFGGTVTDVAVGMEKQQKAMGAAIAKYTALIGVTASLTKAGIQANVQFERMEQVLRLNVEGGEQYTQTIMDMTNAMAVKTGVDQNQIAAAATLLLQYDNLGNEAAILNGEFEQALSLTLDLSSAMGITVPRAAKILGQAFTDPMRAMQLFGRYGIQVTESQQEMMAAMIEAGDAAGAQALLFEVLNDNIGGMSEASATLIGQIKQLGSVIWSELGVVFVDVLKTLTPLIEGMMKQFVAVYQVLKDLLGPILQALISLLETLFGIVGPIIDLFVSLLSVLEPLSPVLNLIVKAVEAVIGVLEWLINIIGEVISWISSLISKLSELLSALNPFSSFSFRPFRRGRFEVLHHDGSVVPRGFHSGFFPRSGPDRRVSGIGLGPGVHVTINTGVGDPVRIANEVRSVLRRDAHRRGVESVV